MDFAAAKPVLRATRRLTRRAKHRHNDIIGNSAAGIRHVLVDGTDEIEIAYTFKREFWGQEIASEIASGGHA